MATNNLLALLLVIAVVLSFGNLAVNFGIFAKQPVKTFPTTGFAFGTTQANVPADVVISLPNATVNFGSMSIGTTNNTNNFVVQPFLLQNDGSIGVNVTMYATDLWLGTGAQNPSYFYQFNVTINETGVVANPLTDLANTTASTAFINVTNSKSVTGVLPSSKVLTRMNYTNTKDAVNVQKNITAPADEPQGSKSSTVTFTAS